MVVHPQDDNAVLRIINMPPRGIGARSIEAVQAVAQDLQTSLWEALLHLATNPKNSKLIAFVNLIQSLQTQAQGLDVAETVQAALNLSGLVEHYQNAKGDNQERIDNLQELISAAMAFKPDEVVLDEWASPETETLPLVAFLSNASLEAGER